MKKNILLVIFLFSLLLVKAFAAESFVVKRIEVEGLSRISAATVYSYIPIKQGQVLRSDKTAAVISALYKTGFFEHISLGRHGNTLIIRVVERPTIGRLKISGNSVIATDKLNTVMKSVDIAEGRIYNRAMLDKIKQSLLSQYYQLGRYNARVDVTVTPEGRNRVLVKIDISEGLVAKVDRINIIGNHAFSEGKLTKQLDLTTPGLFTIFTQTDRYSQEKLDSSLESLRNYYLDHGYIKFAIKSAQVEITPDRKSVYLNIVIDEGAQYTVSGFTISGNTIVPHEEMMKLVTIQKGDIFSRKTIMSSEKSMSEALGDKGYVSASIAIEPKINEVKKEVFLTFTVKPGKRTYVRHIYFSDNTKTNDIVLRRELIQMESSIISTKKLDESKHRMSLQPYVKNVEMGIVPVEHSDDLVDVNYKITEQNAAEATFSVGYSQIDHLILGLGFNQKNFLGTGKTLGVSAQTSGFQKFYGVNYTDPYYTADGISRTISLSISKFDPGAARISNGYTDDQYSATVLYGIPLGQEEGVFNRVQLGFGYEGTLVKLRNAGNVSNQILDFVNNNGRHFQELNLIAGYSRDSRDRAIFPTKGMIHSLSGNLYLPLTSASLKFYTASYGAKWYQPIYGQFIAAARADLAMGSSLNGGGSNYPFFKNYYAGGIETVRAYLGNTLGPYDSTNSPTGGNVLTDASIGLIFPNPIPETLRTTAFVDGGNVYNTFDNRKFGGRASGPLRFSYGVEADWLTPLGVMIDISYARPINLQPGDRKDYFQFSLGANFG